MTNPISEVKVASVQTLNQTQEVSANETLEVNSSEAKQLEEAKTNENANVSVELAEPEQKEEKGLLAKIGNAFKAIFSKEN